jgi:hypothetical protein
LIEVEDILDELHTLKRMLKDQEAVILDLNETLRGFETDTHRHRDIGMRTLTNHLHRINQMEETAANADTAVRASFHLQLAIWRIPSLWTERQILLMEPHVGLASPPYGFETETGGIVCQTACKRYSSPKQNIDHFHRRHNHFC